MSTPQPQIEHKHAKFFRDGEAIPVEDIEYTIDEEWDRMLGDTEAADLNEYYAKIYRTRDGKRHYLFRALPTDFPISDRIRDTYGTGDYEVWMMRKNKIAARTSKAIEAPPDWKAPTSEAPVTNESAAIVASIEKLGDLFLKMQANNPATLPAPAGPMFDPIAMQQSMLGVMLQAKQLFAPSEKDSGASAMEAFVKGVEIAKDIAGGGNETNLLDVVLKMAEPDGVFGQLTKMAKEQQNALVSPPDLVGADGRPLPKAIEGGPTPEQRQAQTEMFLKAQLGMLVAQAAAGKDPALYAELILDNMPTEAVQKFVGAPDAIQKLQTINPNVAQHAEWFAALGDHITQMLSDEMGTPSGDDDGGIPTTTTGDNVAPTDTPSNETKGNATRDS
jgi:hypothetical protein